LIAYDKALETSTKSSFSQTGSETSDESQAVADRIVKATEDLTAALQAYAGTSSAAATSNNTSTTQSLGANGRLA
jgi:hypothetical protein